MIMDRNSRSARNDHRRNQRKTKQIVVKRPGMPITARWPLRAWRSRSQPEREKNAAGKQRVAPVIAGLGRKASWGDVLRSRRHVLTGYLIWMALLMAAYYAWPGLRTETWGLNGL